MTREDADLILSIDEIKWEALCRVFNEHKEIQIRRWANNANSRDEDQEAKGRFNICEEFLSLKNQAMNLLHPKEVEER